MALTRCVEARSLPWSLLISTDGSNQLDGTRDTRHIVRPDKGRRVGILERAIGEAWKRFTSPMLV